MWCGTQALGDLAGGQQTLLRVWRCRAAVVVVLVMMLTMMRSW